MSVCPSVRRTVGCSVTLSLFDLLGASCAVYSALFSKNHAYKSVEAQIEKKDRGPTDQRTDKASYRDALTHLKIGTF